MKSLFAAGRLALLPQTAALLLIFASRNLAFAGHVTVGAPSGSIQSSSFASDFSAAVFSPPNAISIGPADNPFDRTVGTSTSIATASAGTSASLESSFSWDDDSFDITSLGAVTGVTSAEAYIGRAHAVANSIYQLSFSFDAPFNYTLSATTLRTQDGVVDVGLYTGGLSGTAVAYGGGTFTGTLPAGSYEFRSFLSIQSDSANAIISDFDSASFTVSFHGEVLAVPEPSSIFIGLAMCGCAGWRERTRARCVARASRQAAR